MSHTSGSLKVNQPLVAFEVASLDEGTFFLNISLKINWPPATFSETSLTFLLLNYRLSLIIL